MFLRNLNIKTGQRRVLGTPKLGVLGSQVPPAGQNAGSLIYPSLSLPADANKQYRVRMLTYPEQGKLFVREDGSFEYDGTGAVGVQTATAQLYEGTMALGSPITIYFDTGATFEIYGVSVNPTTVQVAGDGTRTFSAIVWGSGNPGQAVTWSATEGTISELGEFTAPPATTVDRVITISATSVADGSKVGNATVTVPASVAAPTPTITSVTVSPATATVVGDATRQFTASVVGTNNPPASVTWETSAGTIGTNGLFRAPPATEVQQVVTVTARSTIENTMVGTATVTIPAAAEVVSQYPSPADVRAGVRYGASGELTGTMTGGGVGILLGRGIGVTLDGGMIIGLMP